MRTSLISGYENYTIYEDSTIVRNSDGKVIKHKRDKKGYHMVGLSCPITKKRKSFRVHRLVALHFCEGYGEGKTVDHLDMDKDNNHADNLEWVELTENIQRALSKSCYVEGKRYRSISEASRETGISHSTIRGRIKNKMQGYF